MENLLEIKLPYEPFLKQARFHASPAPYRLFGGAAGPGKTEAIMWEGIVKCLLKPKINGVLFRKTFPELEMSLIRRFLEKMPGALYHYNVSKHLAIFNNGSTLQFAYSDSEKDIYRYQSAEYDFIGVDELTHFTEYFFTYIISRLRTVKQNVRPSFFAATNPGNVGHSWVKARWIDKDCKEDGYVAADYEFIPALIRDNPILMENDPAYLTRLNNLPEMQRKALLEGSFDIAEGQFFREWNRDVHTVNQIYLMPTWKKYITFDYGSTNPFAAYWIAVDYDGVCWVYREMYVTGKDADVNAAEMVRLSQEDPINPETGVRYETIVSPMDIFAKAGHSMTIAEVIGNVLAKGGLGALTPSGGQTRGSRVTKAALMHQYLRHNATERPKIRFFAPGCPNAIKTIPALIHSQLNPEDVDGENIDHAYDSISQFLTFLHQKKSPLPMRQKTMLEKKLEVMKELREADEDYNTPEVGEFSV